METPNNDQSTLSTMDDDISRLLNLEALKRFGEEAHNIKRQTEEKVLIFLEKKREYHRRLGGLAKLSKQAKLFEVHESKNMHIDDKHAANSAQELSEKSARISSDQRPTPLDMSILEDCKKQLENLHNPRKLLAKHQLNFAENRETLKSLRISLDNVENGFESATLLAFDQLSSEFPPASNE